MARTASRGGWAAATVAALALLALLIAAPGRADAAQQTCPATFRVLHDDHIGKLRLRAGPYRIILLNPNRLSCSAASDLFRQFLEDFDGRLPPPWVTNVARARFTRGPRSNTGFRVVFAGGGGGGGGGGHHPATGRACPGFFRVLHNDRIGPLRLPAGRYRITLLAVGRLGCPQASDLFTRFLQDFDGRLPRPWKLDPRTGTFFRGLHIGFRVKPASGRVIPSGGGNGPSGGGVHPGGGGHRCPATFRVLHSDRIGKLRLPAGRYWITVLQRTGLSCTGASRLFTSFLDDFSGDLPSPWRLEVESGTFRRGKGGVGFRVKQV